MITDHDHLPERRGPWRGPRCHICGERNATHLSWGREVAESLGGDPASYVDDPAKWRTDGPSY